VEPQQSSKSWNVEFDSNNQRSSSPSWCCGSANWNTQLHKQHDFLRALSIITQSATLQCLLLDCSSNKSSKNRWKWPPCKNGTINWHQQMSQACPSTPHDQRHTNCQSDVSKYDPLNQDLGSQSDGIYPHCHMMLSMRRKENHPSAMTILTCPLTATIATNRSYSYSMYWLAACS
jgi:hypothetical protein